MNIDEGTQDGETGEVAPEHTSQPMADDSPENESPESTAEADKEPGGQSFTEKAAEALDDLPGWAAEKLESFEDEDDRADAVEQEMNADDAESAVPPPSEHQETAGEASETSQQAKTPEGAPNLDMMLDLPLDVNVELGRAELPLAQVLELKAGSVIQLDRLPGEPLDLYVNDQLVAKGEIVVLNETFAFRITDLMKK